MEQFFATCPRGLEGVLESELVALGAQSIAALDGGVRFCGDLRLCYAANLESRVASRVRRWRPPLQPYLRIDGGRRKKGDYPAGNSAAFARC